MHEIIKGKNTPKMKTGSKVIGRKVIEIGFYHGIVVIVITKTMRYSISNIQITKNETISNISNINNNSGLCQ